MIRHYEFTNEAFGASMFHMNKAGYIMLYKVVIPCGDDKNVPKGMEPFCDEQY